MSETTPRWHAPALYLGIIAFWAMVARIGLPQGDFANYWTAASLWWEGADLSRLYDYRWFTDQAARLGFGDQLVGFAVLSPPSALWLAPLLPLGLHGAQTAWMMIQGLLALGTGAVLCHWLKRPHWMGPALLLASAPLLRAHLVQGQFHLPVVLLLSLGLWAWMRQRPGWAGLSLGLAMGLKVHAWPLLLLAVLARKWRIAGWMLGTLVVGGLCSVVLLGWEVHQIWFSEIAPAASVGSFIDPWNVSFQSLGHGIRRLFLPHEGLNPHALSDFPELARGLPVAMQVLIVGMTLIPALRWSELSSSQRARLLAASSISALLSGPLLASYHLVLVLPAVVLTADQLARAGEGRRAGFLLLLALCLAWWPVPQAWPDSAGLIPMALTRFWLLLWIWVLIVPAELIFARRPSQSRARLGVLVLAMAGGTAAAREPIIPDHAQPLELAAMPLVAADLIYTSDGSLWFSGIPARGTSGLSGQGWVGYQLQIDRLQLWPVVSDSDAHVWSPRLVDEAMTWIHGPGADLGEAGVPCRDGYLEVIETDDGPQIGLSDALGRVQLLTWTRAHYANPACDEAGNRAWFLSDRGVGVRALRLWWVPLTERP